jgi:hypothetical protein
VVGVARRNFQSLKDVARDKVVLLAEIPDYRDEGLVQITDNVWPNIRQNVKSVTIALESGMFSTVLCDKSGSTSYQRWRLDERLLVAII